MTEWFPSLVQSTAIVNCLPDSPSVRDSRRFWLVGNPLIVIIQDVSWVPLEVVGSVVAEIRNASSNIVHIAHPKPVSWRYIFDKVSQTIDIPVVPFSDWLARLEALTTSSKGNDTKAIALLETCRTVDPSAPKFVPRMASENALRESPTLAALQPLTDRDIDSWLSYLKSVSLISF